MPWAAASAPSAPNSASVTTWLTSTFPATTAAGGRGLSIEPAGATIDDVLNALESNRIILTVFAPDVEHYTELATVDKCEYQAVKGGATPQESLEIFSKDRSKFQETLQKLGRTLSQTVAATPL